MSGNELTVCSVNSCGLIEMVKQMYLGCALLRSGYEQQVHVSALSSIRAEAAGWPAMLDCKDTTTHVTLSKALIGSAPL